MKGERKLSLVKPPPGPEPSGGDDADLEREATPEELREAEALRRAMERGEEPMALALQAAFRPRSLEDDDLDAILARAMGDDDARSTSIEEREADRLRATLEEHDALRTGRIVAGPGARSTAPEDTTASAAIALRAAWAPTAIGTVRNDALVSKALERAGSKGESARGGASNEAPAPISLRRFRMGPRTIATITTVVAMAAGVLLMVGRLGRDSASAPASVAQAPAPAATAVAQVERVPRIAARSTQELFDAATPFPRSGGESARVDRIATARAADLRANRFAAWGIR